MAAAKPTMEMEARKKAARGSIAMTKGPRKGKAMNSKVRSPSRKTLTEVSRPMIAATAEIPNDSWMQSRSFLAVTNAAVVAIAPRAIIATNEYVPSVSSHLFGPS